ncbi:MAG: O-methyltransferase [Bacteroidales bacterium]
MFELVSEALEEYCEAHTTPENELLYQLNRETHLKVLRPRMLSGLLQGEFLSMISQMIRPKYILEIGTYTGYATLCLANGLEENGCLDTIEIDEELEELIRKYWKQSPYSQQIHLHIGDANHLIPTLNKPWDLVFMDAEKKDYLHYYEMILPQMRKGGFLLVDNVLWSGKVVEEVAHNDKETKAILAFNHHIQQDSRVRNVMLPFRDGLSIIMKL